MAENTEYEIVVAIDFGTSYSGYAYSFASDKNVIHVNKNWGENLGFMMFKTPTCLLLKPDEQFEAFGFQAVSRYGKLSKEEASQYYYFDRFKMKLYNNKSLNTGIQLKAANGKTLPAVTVFRHSLNFMKEHVLGALKQVLGETPDCTTIQWVLTVPAIWQDNAKQFMREAASKIDMIPKSNSNQLIIALEPEAAAIHCRHLAPTNFVQNKSADSPTKTSEHDSKSLIVDAGGGTVDCVVHEIGGDGKVHELSAANGGPWGGTTVDKEFQKLLDEIFSETFMQKFKQTYPNDYTELMQDFEIKKRDESGDVRVTLPYNFTNFKHDNVIVEDAISKFAAKKKNEVKFTSGKLELTSSLLKSLFAKTIAKITNHVEDMLTTNDVRNIYLVGGFAESRKLQDSINARVRGKATCLIPQEASLAVVRGAVAFGHDPSVICQRVCRYTYGTKIKPLFIEGEHREDLKVKVEGIDRCDKVFSPWVQAGDVIGYNEVKWESYNPIQKNQDAVSFEIYRSPKKQVNYTDEVGLERIGYLKVLMPDLKGGTERCVELEITFGGTEIKVVGKDVNTSKTYETVIDFLSL